MLILDIKQQQQYGIINIIQVKYACMFQFESTMVWNWYEIQHCAIFIAIDGIIFVIMHDTILLQNMVLYLLQCILVQCL